MRTTLVISLVLLTVCTFGQTQEELILQQEKLDQQQAEAAKTARLMDEAIELLESEEYKIADFKFKEVLEKSKVVPSVLTFYFGKNSFYLGKYQQSIDWLNKYIQLKGTKGRFYEECVDLLSKSEEAYLLVRKEEAKDAEQILTKSYDIDCGPSGKVICPVCKGRTVIIKKGAFGRTYSTCPYSDDHGHLTCQEYNQLLRGQLKPKNQ